MWIFLSGVVLFLLARLELTRWGLLLDDYERAALIRALLAHSVALAVVMFLFAAVRTAPRCRAVWPKVALAALPLLAAASADRLATIHHRPIRYEPGLFAYHPRRGWMLNPGFSGSDYGRHVEINRQGFRGPEVPLTKADDEWRLMLLGDSVAAGYWIPEPDALAEKLRRGCLPADPRKHLTVVNASIRAYSPWQEYDLLTHEGSEFDPDLIVHVFCLNDVLEKFGLIRFGGWTLGQEPPRPSPVEWSGLFRLIRDWRKDLLRPSEDELRAWRYSISSTRLLREPDAAKVREGWDMALHYLDKCIVAAREQLIPFVIVCAPALAQLAPGSDFPSPSPQAVLRQFAEQRGVPYLDLLPVFDQHIHSTGIRPWDLYIDHIHFSAAGHTVAAETLCRFLSENGMLGK